MRSSPTWAYHGGARSWGDIGNNGKYLSTYGTGAADRGQMHYRSGLNMIPLIEWYRLRAHTQPPTSLATAHVCTQAHRGVCFTVRAFVHWCRYRRHPEEGTFLLEISMGAIAGQMTNIDPQSGASSMMYHAAMHMLAHDPHTGDYGLGFFGNALESGAYYVVDDALGRLCYLCDLIDDSDPSAASTRPPPASTAASAPVAAGSAHIVPRDAYRRAVYLEPLGLYLTSECGQLAAVLMPSDAKASADPAGSTSAQLTVTFSPSPICAHLRLRLTKTAHKRPGSGFAVAGATLVRGAYQITPAAGGGETTVEVTYTAGR